MGQAFVLCAVVLLAYAAYRALMSRPEGGDDLEFTALLKDRARLADQLVPSQDTPQEFSFLVIALDQTLPFGVSVRSFVKDPGGATIAEVEPNGRGVAVTGPLAIREGTEVGVAMGGRVFGFHAERILGRVRIGAAKPGRNTIIVPTTAPEELPAASRLLITDPWRWPVSGAVVEVAGHKEAGVRTTALGYGPAPAGMQSESELVVRPPPERHDLLPVARVSVGGRLQTLAYRVPWRRTVRMHVRWPAPPESRTRVWVRRDAGTPQLLHRLAYDRAESVTLKQELPPGSYQVWAESGDYLSGPRRTVVGQETAEAKVTLGPWNRRVVEVRLSDGQRAIARLKVTLSERSARIANVSRRIADAHAEPSGGGHHIYVLGRTYRTMTDKEGRASFPAVVGGRYELLVASKVWELSRTVLVPDSFKETTLDLGVVRSVRGSGKLSITLGKPSKSAIDVSVIVVSEHGQVGSGALTVKKPILLKNLKMGIYSIRLKGSNPYTSNMRRVRWLSPWRNVVVRSGDLTEVVFGRR